jgi:hypothetical protein
MHRLLVQGLNVCFAPEAAGREAFGQNLRPHPKRSKPSCQRLTHGEQLRSKCSAILTSVSRIALHADAVIACKAEITGVFGEAVVGRHMGRSRAPRWGHPNATSGQLDLYLLR